MRGLRRLSGGASRVTSAFELETPGRAARPLILQMDRGVSAQNGRVRMEGALLRAAAAAGVPVPGVVALGDARRRTMTTSASPGWWSERLEGETIPRKILRDDEWAGARARPDRPGAAGPWPPSTRSTRAPSTGWRRPTRWATPFRSSMRWARSGRRSSSACAGWPPTDPPDGPRVDRAR